MRMCQEHWTKLKTAISERGLDGLVAKTGEQAAAQAMSSLKDGTTKTNFDPLMAAHNMILSRALDTAGLELMAQNDDGSDRCPLCFLNAAHEAGCKEPDCTWTYDLTWIPGPADAALAEARRLGLVGTDDKPAQ
jgi:hypothetical protein